MTPAEYSVGLPYHPRIKSWPETGQYNFRGGVHELVLFWRGLDKRTIDAVRRGRVTFAIYTEGALLLLLYQIEGACDWSDAPYSWHLVPAEQRSLPEPVRDGEETRDYLRLLLVDAGTGIVRAIRLVSFSPAFTVALRLAIAAQAGETWDQAAYDLALDRLYRRYPASAQLAAVATARCVGGA